MASSLAESPDDNVLKRHLVTIVKILDPVSFKVRECPNDNMSKSARDFIQLESMVLSSVDQYDIESTEISLPSKGSYVIVKPRTGVIWSRGRVDNLLETSKEVLANVYLIDEGITVSVPLKCLRYPPSKMFEVPFQAFDFILFELKPLSLSLNEDMMVRRMPSDRWDPSTDIFVRNFLAGKSTVEIEVQKRDSNGKFYGKMFSPIDEEVCLNEELVFKGYALCVKKQYKSPIPKSCIAELKNHSGSDSGVQVEETPHNLAASIEIGVGKEFESQKPNNTLQLGLQQFTIGSGTTLPTSIGRGVIRRRRNLQGNFSLLQPAIDETFCAIKPPPQTFNFRPDESPIKGLGRGILNYEIQNKYNNLKRRDKGLSPEMMEGGIDEGSQEMDNWNLLRKFRGPNKSIKTEKDELSCETENASRSSSQLSGFNNQSVEKSSESNSRMSELLEFSEIVESGNDPVQNQFASASPLNSAIAMQEIVPQPLPRRLFNSQRFLEMAKKSVSNIEDSSQSISSPDQGFDGIEVQSIDGTNRSGQSQIENAYSTRSSPIGIESYKKYLGLRNKKLVEGKLKSNAVEKEDAEVCSPEWERYKKYAKIREKTSLKEDNVKRKTVDDTFNVVLKPLPNKLSRNVAMESVAKSQSTPVNSPKKINEVNNIERGILNHINSEGVLSFLHQKVPSNENTYTLLESHKAHKTYSLLKEDLNRMNIMNVICLGNQVPTPSLQINDYYFEDRIAKALKACKVANPTVLQSYMWPAILRGRNCVAVGLKNAGKTFGYTVPILNDFSQEGKYEDLPPGPGPLAIILCTNWMVCQNVQENFDKCNTFSRRFSILTIHGGDNIEKKMTEFLRGYEVLVTTPSIILKLMKNEMNINIIERCCHLILDDADHLIEIFHNEILEFFSQYRTVIICRGKNTSSPNQFVVCSTAWTKGVKSFVRMIANPILLFSNFLEAAIQTNIPFYVDICKQYQEVSVIADILGRYSNCNIVICCTSSENVRNLAPILKSHSFHLLIAHEEMNKPDLENVKHQWKASADCANHPILIVSDVILPLIEISNAECLIHYNLPDLSKLQFSNRFSCLRDVISFWYNVPQDNPKMVAQAQLKECVNYIVINDKNSHQSCELMKIMRRMNYPIPESLSKLADMELMTRQLCDNLLSFGKCEIKEICRQRHIFHPSIDQPNKGMPNWGNVDLLITHVINAGLYYGNIQKYRDPNNGQEVTEQHETFLKLNLNLTHHFEGNKVKEIVTEPQVDEICAFRGVGGAYFRVKIREVIPTRSGFTRKVIVVSIDQGWTRTVELDRIFVLPKEFADFPPQAVQIRLCKVKPMDGGDIWTSQANSFANDLVKDKELRGNVVLSFHNCIFVTNLGQNPISPSSDANSMLISIVSKLKTANFAVSNPNHIESLLKQCKGTISWTSQPHETSKVNLSSFVTYESFEHHVSKAVFLISVQSPSLFYTVPVENYENLLELNDMINNLLVEGKLKRMKNLRKNALVLGPYIPEQRWYRARITEVIKNRETIVRLFFPDFGDECSAVEDDIYEISPDLLNFLPFQAVECSLVGVSPAHGGWSEAAIESFTDFTREDDDDSVYRKFTLEALQTSPAVNSNANHYCVSLYFENGLSLAKELIKKGVAEDVNKLELPPNSSTTDSECDDSADEELNRLEREYDNNFTMLLNGFDPKYIQEFRGYQVLSTNGPKLREIENQPDKLQNCLEQTAKPKPKSVPKEIKSVPKDFYPIPTLLVCKYISRSQPKTTWFQTDESVIVHFELICSEYFADIGENFLSFRTIRGNKFYDFKEDFYSNIIPQNSTSTQLPLYAKFCLKKAERGVHWPKLVKSDEKKPHITLNLDHIDDDYINTLSVLQKPLRMEVQNYIKHHDTDSSSEYDDDDLFIEEIGN